MTIQDSRVVQIEKAEKIRFRSRADLTSGGIVEDGSRADRTTGGSRTHNGP
ncbi:MAG: YezD family protein [Candidatus Omnitrophica bacterium]|nr:YezD family protein [Candidatus Omnitrophota bacterium]